MHLRLPHLELGAINWQPVWRDLTRHDPVLSIARVSQAIYYGLHSTPTELRYDADGTTHYNKQSENVSVVPTLATVVAEAESACRYLHRAVLRLLPISPSAAS